MKVFIVSDAWHPQVNGVVRTLEATSRELGRMGHEVRIVGPAGERWSTFAAPTYPDIKLEFFARPRLRREMEEFAPDFIHIATEGPLGWAARNLCLQLRKPFTTSYHTRFPEYLAARSPRLLARGVRVLTYAVLRRFHAPAGAIMVATPSIEGELKRRRFRRIARWSRGVDTGLFQPREKELNGYAALPRPLLLYVGRVAVEKNLRAFLDLDTPGSKIIVGDGPDLPMLREEYKDAHFLGPLHGEALAAHYAAADLFVFPSRTDTFGLVLLEACAAGLRVASYPAPGPADIFSAEGADIVAALDHDLGKAVERALALPADPELPRKFVEAYSWESCTRQFFHNLQAPTPKALRRITRIGNWLKNWWRHRRGHPAADAD